MKLAEWELVNGSRSRDVGGEQITRHVVEPRVGNCLRSGGRYVFPSRTSKTAEDLPNAENEPVIFGDLR